MCTTATVCASACAMAVTALASVWLGDYSSLLNGSPIVLATNAYSRDHEREADAYARELACAGGVNPARIAVFFERLREKYGHSAESPSPSLFSSHPADSERIAFFTKPEGSPAPKTRIAGFPRSAGQLHVCN